MTIEFTLLRTAGGSPPSFSQYQILKQLGVRVISTDINPLSNGFLIADRCYRVKRVSEQGYIDQLLDICDRESVNLLLPALDEEMLLIADRREEFSIRQCSVMIPSKATLEICTDKWNTYRFFTENHIPTPSTWHLEELPDDDQLNYPLIVKPRRGRGAINVYLAYDRNQAIFFANYIGDAVIQTQLKGDEFTIDVLADNQSQSLLIAPRVRIATDSGISSKGIHVWDSKIVALCQTIITKLSLIGPANIQCFRSPDGDLSFTEVNPRLAGTMILSQMLGVPMLEYIIQMAQGQRPKPRIEAITKPQIMIRSWQEHFLTLEEATKYGWDNPYKKE